MTNRILPFVPGDNPSQVVAALDPQTRALIPNDNRQWVSEGVVTGLGQDGTVVVGGVYLPTIGTQKFAIGDKVPVLVGRSGPVAVIANRRRDAIPALRRALGGVVEELFLAPVDDTFRNGIWFRNDQQCAPLKFTDPDDALQKTVQVWKLLEDGAVSIVQWGEGGNCFFVRRQDPITFADDTHHYYIFTLDRQPDRVYGKRPPVPTLAKTLTLTEALTLDTVDLSISVGATVACPILSRTATLRSNITHPDVTKYDSWSAAMLGTEPTYTMTVGRTATIVDDTSLGGGTGDDIFGCELQSDFLTKDLEIISIFFGTGIPMAAQPFAEPRISTDGQTVTWPTRNAALDARRCNGDLAVTGSMTTPNDWFVVNRSTRTLLWASADNPTRSLTGTVRHPAHTLFSNIRAGVAQGGTSEDPTTPARGTCILDAEASAVNDAYVGMQLLLVQRSVADPPVPAPSEFDALMTWGRIVAYNGSSKTATLEWGSGWLSPTEAGASHYAIWSSPTIPVDYLQATPVDNTTASLGRGPMLSPLNVSYRNYVSAEVHIQPGGGSPDFYTGMRWRGFPLALVKTTCAALTGATSTGPVNLVYARRANKTITITNTSSAATVSFKVYIAEPPASYKIVGYGTHAVIVEGNATMLTGATLVPFYIGGDAHNNGGYSPGLSTYNAGLNQTTITVVNTMNTSGGTLGRLGPSAPLNPVNPLDFNTLDNGTDWRLMDGTSFLGLGPGGGSASQTYTRDDLKTAFRWWLVLLTAVSGGSFEGMTWSISFDPATQYEIGLCPIYTLTGGSINTSWDALLTSSTLAMGNFGSNDIEVIDSPRRLIGSFNESATQDLPLTSGFLTAKLGFLPSTPVDFTTVAYVLFGPSDNLISQPGLIVGLTGTVKFTALTETPGFQISGFRFGRRLFLVGGRTKPGATVQEVDLISIGIGQSAVGDTGGVCYTPNQSAPIRFNPNVFQTIGGLSAYGDVTTLADWAEGAIGFRGGTRQHVVWVDQNNMLKFTTCKNSVLAEDLVTVQFDEASALNNLEILNPDFLWHNATFDEFEDPPHNPLNPLSWYFKSWRANPIKLTLTSKTAAMLKKLPEDIFPAGDVRQVVNDKSLLGPFTYQGP